MCSRASTFGVRCLRLRLPQAIWIYSWRRPPDMWLIRGSLRRPITVMVAVLAVALAAYLALRRMPADIFPNLGSPTVYVAQPYGGLDPSQMEGFITYYYEYHFLYITGIERVESKSIQGVALIKLVFHPGTDMAGAMAEVVGYVNRARAFMPTGAVQPFIVRYDAGSVPVGQLVFSSSADRSAGEMQNIALNQVRPLFATLPGVSAPPPFGGNQRTAVVRLNPDKMRQYRISPDEAVAAVSGASPVLPSGNDRATVEGTRGVTSALAARHAVCPKEVSIELVFDQSKYVANSIQALIREGLLGAVLTGVMVLLFLRDWRGALIVIITIPISLLAAVVWLWAAGQTINIMTLGGLALAVGVLVDEATVEIENIHSHMAGGLSRPRAVRDAARKTAIPRMLAMLSILAVFVPSFFMVGVGKQMFIPLSLAVGFAMISSYVLSTSLVPVLATWVMREHRRDEENAWWRRLYGWYLQRAVRLRWLVIA